MPIYSDIAAMNHVPGLNRPETTESNGRVRVLVIDTTVKEAGKEVVLAEMQAGRFRILGIQSSVTTGASAMSIGVGAYTGIDRDPVAAAPAALRASAAGAANANLPAAGASGLLVKAGSGWTITATATADLAAGYKITGTILYVND